MTIEEHIEAMLPLQREVIAKASLAGVRFDVYQTQERVRFNDGDRIRGEWRPRTYVHVILPDGEALLPREAEGFDDVYEAALMALNFLFPPDPLPATVDPLAGAFVLREDNEQ